jgi:hypothetical protein
MPRYYVKERRCYNAEYLVDAVDEEAASHLRGDIVAEEANEWNSWGEELLEVSEVEDDREFI